MTRTHTHSNGPKAESRDHHLTRKGAGGATKKGGAGKHNWGTTLVSDVDEILAHEHGDRFASVADKDELEHIADLEEALDKKYEGRVQSTNAEAFEKEHGVNVDSVREAAREHVPA